jgi:hypothetical protein
MRAWYVRSHTSQPTKLRPTTVPNQRDHFQACNNIGCLFVKDDHIITRLPPEEDTLKNGLIPTAYHESKDSKT